MYTTKPAARFTVGLTGGIGCGKTTVANLFAQRGAAVIDTDQIAHQLTAPNGLAIGAIRDQFGTAFLLSNGAMDRAKMREYVFNDPAARKRLESILHPLIRAETENAAMHAHGIYLILVVPLLIESASWKERVSRVLVVDCPEEHQIARVMSRNGLSQAQVLAIMEAQVSRKTRLATADDVIENEGDQAELEPQIERLHALYASLSGQEGAKDMQHL